MPPEEVSGEPAQPQKVWDGATRLFHWSLAGLFLFSWWTAEEHLMNWHRISGFTILGLLVFRIYWGFAGPNTARFAHFIKGPVTTLRYAAGLFGPQHKETAGHNPVGALSVIAMLLALVAQVTLGLFAMDTDGIESGPLARFISYDQAELAGELHETMFDVLLVLVGLHIAAIAFYLIVKRANLIGPMITGRRRFSQAVDAFVGAPLWRLALGIALAGLVVWLVIR